MRRSKICWVQLLARKKKPREVSRITSRKQRWEQYAECWRCADRARFRPQSLTSKTGSQTLWSKKGKAKTKSLASGLVAQKTTRPHITIPVGSFCDFLFLLIHFNCRGNRRLPLLLGIVVNIKRITTGELYYISNDLIFKDVLIASA
jgi:hypothetical protein